MKSSDQSTEGDAPTPVDQALTEITDSGSGHDLASRPPHEDGAENLDAVIPPHRTNALPVVGLGGSAGATGALREFFSIMPTDSGMAFVVVIHLSPEHESTLPALLQAHTTMPVVAVEEEMPLVANHVYVIPSNVHLTISDGKIQPELFQQAFGRRVAADLFFRSLADSCGINSTGVVLSGLDSDGVIGLKRIKERGGLSLVQEPSEAEHDGMPRSAIAADMVDWILPVAHIPARLIAHQKNEHAMRQPIAPPEPTTQEEMQRAHERTGVH